jgi:hypothetical protein
MIDRRPLEALEDVPEHKNDPYADYDDMVRVIRELPVDRQGEILRALPAWLADDEPGWHFHAALEIAVGLPDGNLLDRAVAIARERGTPDTDGSSRTRPTAYQYQLALVSAVASLPTDAGVAYLRELKSSLVGASSVLKRELAIRAWVALCFAEQGDGETHCLSDAMRQVRQWRDERLRRSAESLLVGLYVLPNRRLDTLRAALSWRERRRVFRLAS